MKVAILFALFSLGACGLLRKGDYSGNIVQLIKQYGYPVESYEVQTQDGYILDLFRINGGRQTKNDVKSSEESSSKSSSEEFIGGRPAVLLMHGMLSNAEDFVVGGPSDGLAFVLADRGYDVYLGNARGSVYGQKHTSLDPKKDAAFWRFCWNEMGVRDLPSIVDKVLSVSGQSKISYIGHNEGTTSFFVFLSEKPEYNDKFDRQISLGPMAYMKNAQDEFLNEIVDHIKSKPWLMKNIGIDTIQPSKEFIQTIETKCVNDKFDNQFCQNAYFLLNGYNSKHFNQTTLSQILPRLPSTGSVREVLHYAQLKASGRFQKYSESEQVEEYDLSKITVPVAILYTPNDPLSHVDDVQYLINKLPKVMGPVKFEQLDNNLDLIYSENVDTIVYEVILRLLKEDPSKTLRKVGTNEE